MDPARKWRYGSCSFGVHVLVGVCGKMNASCYQVTTYLTISYRLPANHAAAAAKIMTLPWYQDDSTGFGIDVYVANGEKICTSFNAWCRKPLSTFFISRLRLV